MSIPGVLPERAQELRDLGYTVTTRAEAFAAAELAYGVRGLMAGVFLSGESDLVDLDAQDGVGGASEGVSAPDGNAR